MNLPLSPRRAEKLPWRVYRRPLRHENPAKGPGAVVVSGSVGRSRGPRTLKLCGDGKQVVCTLSPTLEMHRERESDRRVSLPRAPALAWRRPTDWPQRSPAHPGCTTILTRNARAERRLSRTPRDGSNAPRS